MLNIAPPVREDVLEQSVIVVPVSVNAPSVGFGTLRREGTDDPSAAVTEVKLEEATVMEGAVPFTRLNEMSLSQTNLETAS